MANGIINPGELDLNLLWALDALLSERHVSRAAERIHLGQPAMSAALKRLRFIFKDELLVRQGNQYQLTTLAAELEQPVHDVISQVGRLFTHRPSFDPATSERKFVICAGEYASDVLVSQILDKVMREAPGVRIDMQRAGPGRYDEFREGAIDIYITAPEMTRDTPLADLDGRVVFRDRWLCAVSRDNLEVGDVLTLQQYEALSQIGYGGEGRPRPPDKIQILEWAEPRKIDVWTHSFLSIPSILRGSRMFAIIPVLIGNMLMPSGVVRLIELPFEPPPIEYRMYWPLMYETDPGNVWLRQLLLECVAELGVDHIQEPIR
jgi:DNA-binding transcriptional LysR family regulator